ncbi:MULTISPECIES: helix-turn-helix domain-containing protein [unclassified Paenibacillus]|uniref:helix-turn-helix domain-containing protein n=1 Tax=unclassified Paenibacillus TaxID=185978 RepID=UPI0030FD1FD5
MLSDTARKLLMIMRHSSVHHGYMPTMEQLETKSGRTLDKIRAGLQELADESYIQWQSGKQPETALVLEGWERIKDQPTAISWGIDGSNIDYWTDY